ncbi:hypothetical protein G7A66_12245 [Altererythrobacter sp. SALINAS58]|uniref:PilZ domain-containing protein n=1 Tax=Alteripontixanthobacter muriae TaxID=2705546 RepID=UPI0015753B58|nr:hypothetical protein [Alteripontixanthobacter muriae]
MEKVTKRAQRRLTSLRVQIRRGNDWMDLLISNLSATGFMAKSRDVPKVGSSVEIRHRSLFIRGEVVWATASRFGVRSFAAIDVDRLLARADLGAGRIVAEEIRHAPKKGRWPLWRD